MVPGATKQVSRETTQQQSFTIGIRGVFRHWGIKTEGLFFWVFFFGGAFFFGSIFLVFPKKTTIPSIFLRDLMHFRGFSYEKQ